MKRAFPGWLDLAMSNKDMIKKPFNEHQRGFTLIELMVVVVIIGVLAAIGSGSIRLSILEGHLQSAKPYLMRLAAAQRTYFNRKGVYFASTDEDLIKSTLGVDLSDASDFCFITKTSNFITSETASFEVWAVVRNDDTAGGRDTVSSDNNDTCKTVTNKKASTGWAQEEDAIAGVGRSVVYRYPEPVDGYRDTSNGGTNNQDRFHPGVYHDWTAGISLSNAMFD